jgi:hypothetical protein
MATKKQIAREISQDIGKFASRTGKTTAGNIGNANN